MGLFRKSGKKNMKTEEEDPEWAELKKAREEQKRRILGKPRSKKGSNRKNTGENSTVNSEISGIDREGRIKEERENRTIISNTRGEKTPEFRCEDCGSEYMESWNKCPKCRGKIVIIPSKTKTPKQRSSPGLPDWALSAGRPGARKSTGGRIPGKVKKVKKRKKTSSSPKQEDARRVGAQNGKTGQFAERESGTSTGKIATKVGAGRAAKSEGSISRGRRRAAAGQRKKIKQQLNSSMLDDLFQEDPYLDSDKKVRRKNTSKKLSQSKNTQLPKTQIREKPKTWKDLEFNDGTEDTTAADFNRKPESVKEMLGNLVEDKPAEKNQNKVRYCSKCGFKLPSGDWEFCMKCGSEL